MTFFPQTPQNSARDSCPLQENVDGFQGEFYFNLFRNFSGEDVLVGDIIRLCLRHTKCQTKNTGFAYVQKLLQEKHYTHTKMFRSPESLCVKSTFKKRRLHLFLQVSTANIKLLCFKFVRYIYPINISIGLATLFQRH